MRIYTLSLMPAGTQGVIESIEKSRISKRLLALGFIPGTTVSCLFSAPSGNPKAYFIRGTVIALRNCDASTIKILS